LPGGEQVADVEQAMAWLVKHLDGA
jgi:hypothetical protein